MARRGSSGKLDIKTLPGAINAARKTLEFYRTKRVDLVREYSGMHYGENAAKKRVPINLLGMYVQTVGRNLIARNPRVMLSTCDREMRPHVEAMQSWVNERIRAMYFAHTMQRTVLDALFSVGFNIVALASPADSARKSWRLEPGMPYVDVVDLDDYVGDMEARDRHEMDFEGYRMTRVPYDAIMDHKLFNAKARKRLQPNDRSAYNRDGDERIGEIGRDSGGGYYDEEIRKHVDLYQIWTPSDNTIRVFSAEDIDSGSSDSVPLLEQEWIGPECGPLHMLGYGWVPGNLMPKSPMMDLYDGAETVNILYRKLMRQGIRQKSNTLVGSRSATTGETIRMGNDGDVLTVDGLEDVKESIGPGPSQAVHFLAEEVFKKVDILGGGIMLQAGVAPSSKTATQDKMLNENNSRSTADMQDVTVNHVSAVLESMCWYWYHHPELVMKTHQKLPGLPDLSIEQQVTPQDRQKFRYKDMALKVDPYSLPHTTPNQRLDFLWKTVMQVTPLMPLLQQQGKAINIDFLLKKTGEYGNEPDIEELFHLQPAPVTEGGPGEEEGPGIPAETTRNYNRTSVGMDSAAAEQMQTDNALASGGSDWNGPMSP